MRRTIQRILGSTQKEAIWVFLRHVIEYGLVDARAGKLRDFTIVRGARCLPSTFHVRIFRFNRHVVREVGSQLQRPGFLPIRVLTYHCDGFSMITADVRGVGLDERRPLLDKCTHRRFITHAHQ